MCSVGAAGCRLGGTAGAPDAVLTASQGLTGRFLGVLAGKLAGKLAGRPSREAGGRCLEVLGAAGRLGPDWSLLGEYSHSALVIKSSSTFLGCLAELRDFSYVRLN